MYLRPEQTTILQSFWGKEPHDGRLVYQLYPECDQVLPGNVAKVLVIVTIIKPTFKHSRDNVYPTFRGNIPALSPQSKIFWRAGQMVLWYAPFKSLQIKELAQDSFSRTNIVKETVGRKKIHFHKSFRPLISSFVQLRRLSKFTFPKYLFVALIFSSRHLSRWNKSQSKWWKSNKINQTTPCLATSVEQSIKVVYCLHCMPKKSLSQSR